MQGLYVNTEFPLDGGRGGRICILNSVCFLNCYGKSNELPSFATVMYNWPRAEIVNDGNSG